MNRITRSTLTRVTSAILLSVAAFAASPSMAGEAETQAILERFVEDYRNDVMARNGTFGVRVDGEWWHVTTTGVEPGGTPESVTLHRGQPEEPTWFFWSDFATLKRLDEGTMNAGTAMVKAFSTDVTPMDVDAMEGFQPDEGFLDRMLKATFHFWVRGVPELVPFGEEYTRPSHGGDAVIFYYQPGLRSGWFSIKKGQHVNEDPRMQTNPFPSMLIGTGGACMARIGGKEIVLEEGNMLFIPPGVTHEFWNDSETACHGVLLMFGEGA